MMGKSRDLDKIEDDRMLCGPIYLGDGPCGRIAMPPWFSLFSIYSLPYSGAESSCSGLHGVQQGLDMYRSGMPFSDILIPHVSLDSHSPSPFCP
jgi:hypothetical protein